MQPTNDDGAAGAEGTPVSTRWVELGVGLALMALALLVVADSLRVGAGWADDGPKAGYFPFYIGLALLGASGWTVVTQLRRWQRIEVFAERAQLRSVAAVMGPMVVHVVLIKFIGLYVASALLIGWFMHRHGQHRLATKLTVPVIVPLVVFVVFERWFLVPLPKGPLEALFGY
ncbi:MAG: tripartite tricarboxylate transporter TctB family protein [Betaproteobacteria bacterium]